MSGIATGNEPMYCDRKNSVLEAMHEKRFLVVSAFKDFREMLNNGYVTANRQKEFHFFSTKAIQS